jgi:anti-sigma B factor antagonist
MMVRERIKGDVVVLSLSGDVMNDNSLDKFMGRLDALKEGGQTKVVVNLKNVSLINSVGIGKLIAAKKALHGAGGDMKLAQLSDRSTVVIAVAAGLGAVFDITETTAEAIANFN